MFEGPSATDAQRETQKQFADTEHFISMPDERVKVVIYATGTTDIERTVYIAPDGTISE